MAGRNSTRPSSKRLDNHQRWPVIWRVVAPGCGSFDTDMVFIRTKDETEARRRFNGLLRAKWPVRLERVACGPLPGDAKKAITKVRSANPQNPGTNLRADPGFWTARDGREVVNG